jgi:hypothetical protein
MLGEKPLEIFVSGSDLGHAFILSDCCESPTA